MKHKKIKGCVNSGRGLAKAIIENSYSEIEDLTSEKMYPGSLNIVLNRPISFKSSQGHRFDNGRKCLWRAFIADVKIPVYVYRWKGCPLHIIELISTEKLRERFKLVNGSKLCIDIDDAMVARLPFYRHFIWMILWRYRETYYYNNNKYKDMIYRLFIRSVASQHFDE